MRNALLGTTTAILFATASAAALAQSSVSDDTDIVHAAGGESQVGAGSGGGPRVPSSMLTVADNWRERQQAGYSDFCSESAEACPVSDRADIGTPGELPTSEWAIRGWQALPSSPSTGVAASSPAPDTGGSGDTAEASLD